MSELAEPQLVVPSFKSVADLRAGLESKRAFEPINLYPRDGSELLWEIEARLAHLAGVDESTLLAYNTGMSAVTDAIDIGLHTADTDTPVVACAAETYTQTKRYIEHFLREKRAKVVYFNSGDYDSDNLDAVAKVLDKQQPDVIVAETIGNYLGVPVLDTESLLEWTRQNDKKPTLVLDNTLPLSTGIALGELLTPDDQAIVVESGTKSYTFNGALLGVGYTANEELFDWLRRYRRTRGDLPGPEHLERAGQLLPGKRAEFDERNRRLFKNTGDIAVRLAGSAPDGVRLIIEHPAIPSHKNHNLYESSYPEGGAPVLYVQSSNPAVDQYDVAERLWASKAVREQARLGQSFGFNHTRIVADEDIRAVRIAGGSETDAKALGEACAEALYV